MNFKRIIIIALAIVMFSSINAFAWSVRGTTIQSIEQDDSGIYIRYDSLHGYYVTKTVNAPGVEKNILAIALCAQSSGMTVDIEIISGEIVGITIVSP